MSEDAAHERIAVIWSPEARADLRAIDLAIDEVGYVPMAEV